MRRLEDLVFYLFYYLPALALSLLIRILPVRWQAAIWSKYDDFVLR